MSARRGSMALWGCLIVVGLASAEVSSFECIITPRESLKLGSPLEGTLEKVLVERGDIVRRGQAVAVLVSSVELAANELAKERAARTVDVELAEAQLRLAQKRRERASELVKKSFVSADELDKVRTEEELAALTVKRARDDRRLFDLEYRQSSALLQQKTIRSPIDGVVVDRLLGPGERVESQPILEVAQIDPLYVEAVLPARLLGKVANGDRVTVSPEQPAGVRYSGKVIVVDRVVDAASGTFGVRAELPNPEFRLHAGLSCQLELGGRPTKK